MPAGSGLVNSRITLRPDHPTTRIPGGFKVGDPAEPIAYWSVKLDPQDPGGGGVIP